MANMDATAYKQKFDDMTQNGFITLGIALGHKLGIFELFKTLDKAVTVEEIADALKLKERYVKEWLGSMVAAEIIFIDENKYFVPKECRESFDMSRLATAVIVLAKTFNDVESCFRKDGPIGFDYLDRMEFLEWLDEGEKDSMDVSVEKILLPAMKKFKDGFDTILDLGCGTGRLAVALAKQLPSSSVYGLDMSTEAIEKAKNIAGEQRCQKIQFVPGSVEKLPDDWTNEFDWIVMWDVFHDLPNPVQALREIKRIMKDDGILSLVDPMVHSEHSENAGNKNAAALYTFSMFACLPCSLSSENGAGHGIGWGVEGQEEFLKGNGMKILDKQTIGPNLSTTLFICGKNK